MPPMLPPTTIEEPQWWAHEKRKEIPTRSPPARHGSKCPKMLKTHTNTTTQTFRSEPEVFSQLKWKGLPQQKKCLPNTQLQPLPGQPIIQLWARAITMHDAPRKTSSLLFPWRIPSCGPHYWKIIWWWPYPGRSSSHHTPSGTTRMPHAHTIVEPPDTTLTLACHSSIRCNTYAGWLSFQEEGPNVKTCPLASHGGASVNAIEKDKSSGSKRLKDVATTRRFIYQLLQAACMVSRGGGESDECLFHLEESHNMETCPAVEELLQRLMEWG